jgi:hypothetical protein
MIRRSSEAQGSLRETSKSGAQHRPWSQGQRRVAFDRAEKIGQRPDLDAVLRGQSTIAEIYQNPSNELHTTPLICYAK